MPKTRADDTEPRIRECRVRSRQQAWNSACASLFATPPTVTHRAPLCMAFPRKEYCSGLPFPAPGDPSDTGVKLMSLVFPALQVDSLPLSHLGSPKGTKRRHDKLVYLLKNGKNYCETWWSWNIGLFIRRHCLRGETVRKTWHAVSFCKIWMSKKLSMYRRGLRVNQIGWNISTNIYWAPSKWRVLNNANIVKQFQYLFQP